jgi:hypothetical protein
MTTRPVSMKRTKQIVPILLLFLTCYCNRDKCDEYSGRVLSGKIDTFFGPFKPGNWWVYQNQDSTRKDSVYVTSFRDSLLKDDVNCIVYGLRRFNLHSKYFANGSDISVVYDATSTGISFKTEGGNFPSFTSSTDSLIVSLPAPDNPGPNLRDSTRLNDTTYRNILVGKKNPNTFYFGKDKGLVGWTTPADTFNLVNARIF